jgi:hypothetical protein
MGGVRTSGEFSKISSVDKVIDLQEYLSKPRFSDWVVFEVEFVEPVKRVLVSVHVKRIDG